MPLTRLYRKNEPETIAMAALRLSFSSGPTRRKKSLIGISIAVGSAQERWPSQTQERPAPSSAKHLPKEDGNILIWVIQIVVARKDQTAFLEKADRRAVPRLRLDHEAAQATLQRPLARPAQQPGANTPHPVGAIHDQVGDPRRFLRQLLTDIDVARDLAIPLGDQKAGMCAPRFEQGFGGTRIQDLHRARQPRRSEGDSLPAVALVDHHLPHRFGAGGVIELHADFIVAGHSPEF